MEAVNVPSSCHCPEAEPYISLLGEHLNASSKPEIDPSMLEHICRYREQVHFFNIITSTIINLILACNHYTQQLEGVSTPIQNPPFTSSTSPTHQCSLPKYGRYRGFLPYHHTHQQCSHPARSPTDIRHQQMAVHCPRECQEPDSHHP
jgi:hypothetical protein